MAGQEQKDQFDTSKEMSVRELILKIKSWIHYIKRKWVIILFAGILGGLLGFYYAYTKKANYTATLSFALEDEKGGGGLGGALGLASSLGIDLENSAGGAFAGANLVELMRSRRLVEQTLLCPVTVDNKTISLAEMYIQFSHWREDWEKTDPQLNQRLVFTPNPDRKKFILQQDSVLQIIYSELVDKNLNIGQKDKKVSLISINVTTQNELFSKFFAETLAQKVSDFYIDTRSKKARMNLDILVNQVDSIRTELNSAITGVAVANDNTYNGNPALNIRRTPSARRQVDVQANTAILTQLVTNLELARVTLRKETPLIQIIDTPILPLSKQKPGKLRSMVTGGMLAIFFSMLWFTILLIVKRFLQET